MSESQVDFVPASGLRNRHLQTILASLGWRKYRVQSRFARYRKHTRRVLLKTPDEVRLLGYLTRSPATRSNRLVILIHGWEGCFDSTYILSMSKSLLDAGVDVFRFNLRDHGGSHHLNKAPFNSTMIDEVVSALENLQDRVSYDEYSLVGFSLGGNFCLRVAASSSQLKLARVIAFCPLIDPASTNKTLAEKTNLLYQQYFVRKWRRSLRTKSLYFPEQVFQPLTQRLTTLAQMNEELVPAWTPYNDLAAYFAAYALTDHVLGHLMCPCYLHFANDDMMIPVEDVKKLADNKLLDISISKYGGHCGFLMNWRLDSWQDYRVLQLLGCLPAV